MFASTVPPPSTESAYVDLLRRVNITSDAFIDSDLSGAEQQAACQQLLDSRAPPRLWLRSADIDHATRWLNAGTLRVVVNESILVEKQSEWLSSGLPVARLVAQCDNLCSLSAQRLEHLATVSGAICAHLPVQGTWADDNNVSSSVAQHIKDLVAVAASRHQKIFIASEFASCAQAAALVRLAPDTISLLLRTSDFDTAASDLPATPTDSSAPLRRSFGALVASLAVSDRPDGLLPTVVCDEQGCALGLVYSNAASLDAAIHAQKGIYWSRRRGLWEKGLTSGAGQDLLRVSLDCDSDCLRFVVHQHGTGFCHLERRACWPNCDTGIPALFRTLQSRKASAPAGSYSAKLFNDPKLLAAKILEEARELVESKDADETAWEAADLVFFAAAACVRDNITLADVESHLERRTLKVQRRAGLAKPAEAAAAEKILANKESSQSS